MSPSHRAEPADPEPVAAPSPADAPALANAPAPADGPGTPDELDILVDRLADEQAVLEEEGGTDAFATLPGNRPVPPAVAGEMETLQGFLDLQRATVIWKVTGLSDAQAVTRLVDSGTTVTGLIRHLANAERFWFRELVGGLAPEEVGYTRYEQSGPHAEWAVAKDASLDAALADYATAADQSRAQLHGRDPDEEVRTEGHVRSVRWVVAHMVGETARHAGHLDVLAELLDGRTGE